MATEQQLKDALRQAIANNDTAMADEFAKRIRAGQFDTPQPQASLGQQALGVAENLIGSAAQAVVAPVSGIAGAVASPFVGMAEGGGIVNDIQQAAASVLPPYTETGKRQQQALGEMMQPVGRAISGAPGDFAFEIANSPVFKNLAKMNPVLAPLANDPAAFGAIGASIVPAALEMLGVKGVKGIKTASDARKLVAKELADGNVNINNVTQTLDATGKLIQNQNMKRAVQLLGDDIPARHAAILVERMGPATKNQFNRMLDIVENQRKLGKEYAMENRVTNVIGESLAKRIQDANKVKKAANRQLDEALTSVASKPIPAQQPFQNFVTKLQDAGVAFERAEDGKIMANLDNATINLGDVLSKQNLEKIVNMLDGETITAKRAHEMKRFVREFVSYDDAGITVGAKQSAAVSNAIKDLSTELGDAVAQLSPEYRKANQKFSSVADSLAAAKQQLRGIDIDSDLATAKLGTLSKRIGSNLQSKEQVLSLIDNLDESLKRNGVRYKDDIKQQVAAIDLIDQVFKTSASESPFGFQNQIRMAADLKTGNVLGLIQQVQQGIDAVKKMREPSFEDKMKTLRAMARENK